MDLISKMKFLCVALLFFILLAENSNAQILHNQFGNWAFFTTKQNKKTICYLVGEPTSRASKIKSRNNVYITITNFGDKKEEFSASSGYIYKNNSVSITIDQKKNFKLINKGKLSWAETDSSDKQIIKEMTKGKNLLLKGQNTKGIISKDNFSLIGFTKAMKAMRNKCK